jgi:pimeloyl-ACP methyl ester carboxylesterase
MTVSSPLQVTVLVGDAVLEGDLVVPDRASGLVLFAHGSGSSRHSPRNRRVAATLNEGGIGTLLVDLLTPAEEEADRVAGRHRFDIELLARRLIAAIDWLPCGPAPALRVGVFGASTGAAAALVAAAARPDEVAAVVSRGGRPDLAGPALPRVQAPTLLVVGGADLEVLELNRRALAVLGAAEKQLVVVPGATHLFEEPGALDEVARLAAEWFSRFIGEAAGHDAR